MVAAAAPIQPAQRTGYKENAVPTMHLGGIINHLRLFHRKIDFSNDSNLEIPSSKLT
jgi:hypothetical protein